MHAAKICTSTRQSGLIGAAKIYLRVLSTLVYYVMHAANICMHLPENKGWLLLKRPTRKRVLITMINV